MEEKAWLVNQKESQFPSGEITFFNINCFKCLDACVLSIKVPIVLLNCKHLFRVDQQIHFLWDLFVLTNHCFFPSALMRQKLRRET